ncbi:MAG TPA: HepT-like ribonuclease domain-containing protein [Cytophagaceae bacterium]|jgi:uncharacterized protein with HEPN domain
MDNSQDDIIRLMDIADSIREIQSYIGRADFAAFGQREDIREAVTSQLLQIGGAAALLSDEFKEKHGHIDWDVLIGLQYANYDQQLELDLHPIWAIVHNDLPQLNDELLDLATQLEDEVDLTDVALNEEDLRDLKEQRRAKYSKINQPDLTEDIQEYDEANLPEIDEDGERIDTSFIDKRYKEENILDKSSLDD